MKYCQLSCWVRSTELTSVIQLDLSNSNNPNQTRPRSQTSPANCASQETVTEVQVVLVSPPITAANHPCAAARNLGGNSTRFRGHLSPSAVCSSVGNNRTRIHLPGRDGQTRTSNAFRWVPFFNSSGRVDYLVHLNLVGRERNGHSSNCIMGLGLCCNDGWVLQYWQCWRGGRAFLGIHRETFRRTRMWVSLNTSNCFELFLRNIINTYRMLVSTVSNYQLDVIVLFMSYIDVEKNAF